MTTSGRRNVFVGRRKFKEAWSEDRRAVSPAARTWGPCSVSRRLFSGGTGRGSTHCLQRRNLYDPLTASTKSRSCSGRTSEARVASSHVHPQSRPQAPANRRRCFSRVSNSGPSRLSSRAEGLGPKVLGSQQNQGKEAANRNMAWRLLGRSRGYRWPIVGQRGGPQLLKGATPTLCSLPVLRDPLRAAGEP